ncbi:uncharacterized protein PV06_08960 [Exophiala oligosperma]|uniref:Amino acid permease/ SLC12A domain-containing protein n=1 Tax=Exophiala oligosperma TaxID=215243 RepID=A0A0D2DU71_9EURO|nr:uncharacterized protein PV06_08960 [Exophiala oligosperma]KIW39159.1 hypothetical protein PV06_08960 [Exophiala oligosperma]
MSNSVAPIDGHSVEPIDLEKSPDSTFADGHDNDKDFGTQTTADHYAETGSIYDSDFEEIGLMKQGLHQRHIQMIALAGCIGVGLFLNSGRGIAAAGPLGAFLAYSIMGVFVSSVVLTVGEMGALVPLSGGVVRYADYFVDKSLAFAMGWNQIYSYAVSIPAELVAASVLVEYWTTSISSAVFITIFSVALLLVALVFVRVYGEIEFTFAILKIMLIIGINIMALVITCGGGPEGGAIGFRYWKHPGPFVQYLGISGSLGRFLGFWKTLVNALYAFSGSENISLAAAEVRNPRRSIPKAAKRIFARILMFYVISIFMVGLVVPSNDPHLLKSTGTASQSPFVIAAVRAGIKGVPSIINTIVITSAWSSANSNMLGGPRVLYGLAKHGHAPRIFLRLNRFGVPYVAVSFLGIFMCLGFMTLSSSSANVFGWLQDMVAISTMVNFILILVIYLRYYYATRAQGVNRHTELPWAAPFQPYASWASVSCFLLLYITGGFNTFIHGQWSTETFVSNYLNLPVVGILYVGHKYLRQTKIKPLPAVPLRKFIEHAQNNPEPPPKPKKGLQKLNILWG